MSYADFQSSIGRINDILCAVNLLSWDSRTQMPAGGGDARGNQIATLITLARGLVIGPELERAMDGAERELDKAPRDDIRVRALAQAQHEIGIQRRIPAEVIAELAGLKTRARMKWVEARANNDFAGYAPYIEQMMAVQRKISAAIGGGSHPYDALLGMYEPGMTYDRLQTIYGKLKSALGPLVQKAMAAPQPRVDFHSRGYPLQPQRDFGLKIAQRMGYDTRRGRLDDTVHPFEISFTRDDVRITSRFNKDWMPGGLFSTWHEAGHGMYEQEISPDFTRSIFATDLVTLYAVGGASFAMHEAQSRMWENRICRSLRFWELHFDELREHFPDQLADVTPEEFWRSVNQVRPGPLRSGADELTYDMHIIMRTEIEAGLMAGDIAVADLPGIWAEKVKTYMDKDVPNDTMGVLQDVHWAHGFIGSFPTYTLGNIMSSQLFKQAQTVPENAAGLASGDYAPMRGWLSENVYQYGRSSSSDQTLQRVTGGGLNPDAYIADLTAKVAALTA